jgi:hypothetical protein
MVVVPDIRLGSLGEGPSVDLLFEAHHCGDLCFEFWWHFGLGRPTSDFSFHFYDVTKIRLASLVPRAVVVSTKEYRVGPAGAGSVTGHFRMVAPANKKLRGGSFSMRL